jgi:RNA polymerase sigma-70 factor (ECF subfamily)
MDGSHADVLRRAKRGDQHALEVLLESHLTMVYKFVSMKIGDRHPDVDDIVQETLIAAANSIRNLRSEDEPAVKSWLLTIARHKIADHFRRAPAGANQPLDGLNVAQISAPGQDVHEVVAERDRARRLREAMRSLSADQEEVLVLRFVLGHSGEEVAAITRRTLGAVKALQHRGLASLKRLLASRQEEWR